MVAVSGSGGIAEMYGGKYIDERNSVPIIVANDAYSAVQIVLNNIKKE
jgi:hypothetical protein